MQIGCQVVPTVDGFTPGVLTFFDCQARTLGAAGYQALAAPGGTVSVLLTIMLTLMIAFIGYRMLFGEIPTVREGVLTFVKIGFVLTLSTGWPAYQTLVYDVVLTTPTEIAAEIGAPAELPGVRGDLAARLDGVDQAFKTLAINGIGQPLLRIDDRLGGTGIAPPLFAGFEPFALGAARAVFLASAIGAFALVRLVSGLLLALGPLFILFLLFDGTRGLFEGWARGLIGAALGSLSTTIVLAIELALIEPWLASLVADRAAQRDIIGVPVQLLAMTLVFAVSLAAMLGVAARVGAAFRLPRTRHVNGLTRRTSTIQDRASVIRDPSNPHVPIENRSRAAAIADAVAATERRESLVYVGAAGSAGLAGPAAVTIPASMGQTGVGDRASGSDMRRRATTRVSASAGRRDRV